MSAGPASGRTGRGADVAELERSLRLLHPDGVFELRVLAVDHRKGHTWSGYFDDHLAAARAVAGLSGRAEGCYALLNPAQPELLARACNRGRIVRGNALTTDNTVQARRWLLIDADAVRATEISATDGERAAAWDVVMRVRDGLADDYGWPAPVVADSGNGYHLLYRIDLPVADGGIVKRTLDGIAAWFVNGPVKIDTSVFNPSRIVKLYGTHACKGDSTADRPHRLSRLIEVPEIFLVTRDQLELVAAPAVRGAVTDAWDVAERAGIRGAFDLGRWVADHLPDAKGPKSWSEGPRIWAIPVCPFNADHARGEAFVGELANGKFTAGCRHDSCTWGWHELREQAEPGHKDRTGGGAGAGNAEPAGGSPPPKSKKPAPEPGSFAEALELALADVQNAVGKARISERLPLFMEAADLFTRAYPPTPWLVDGLITRGGIAINGAEPKAAKTWVFSEIAVAIATGTPVFGEFGVQRGRVAYFYAEDLDRQVRNRIGALLAGRDLGLGPDDLVGRLHVCPRGQFVDLLDDKDLAWIVASCRQLGAIDLLVLDPMRDLHSGEEDKSDSMRNVMRRIRLLGELLGCTVAVAHHAGKATADSGKRRPGQRMRGSGAIHGSTDSGLYLGVKGGDGVCKFELELESELKGARSAGKINLDLTIEDDEGGSAVRASWAVSRGEREKAGETGDAHQRTAELAIHGHLARSPVPLTRSAIREGLALRKAVITRAIDVLLERGDAIEVRGRKLGGYWPIWTPERAAAAGIDLVPRTSQGGP